MATAHSHSRSNPRPMPFHSLDVYQVALSLVRLSGAVPAPRGTADARDQLRRASSSVALNIAEASGKTGADRRRFFLIARGSACEAAAALDVLAPDFDSLDRHGSPPEIARLSNFARLGRLDPLTWRQKPRYMGALIGC